MIFSLIPILTLSPKSTSAEVVAAASTKRYLPLVVTPGPPLQARQPVWWFLKVSITQPEEIAKPPVRWWINWLRIYVGKPVVFLEYIYARRPDSRKGRFWEAYGGSSAGYPMIIVDSGHQVQSGVVPYYNTYQSLVDQELSRAPQAGIQATWQRTGDKVTFSIQLINHERCLPFLCSKQGHGSCHCLRRQEGGGYLPLRPLGRVPEHHHQLWRRGPPRPLPWILRTLLGVDWNKLHYLALVDYQPVSGSAYDMLQAAVALPAVSDNPAD